MLQVQHRPQRPAHTIRRGSVEVSVWKWVDGREFRYELTVNRFYGEGEKRARYPERFRADHVTELRAAIDEATSWLRSRQEHVHQLGEFIERMPARVRRRGAQQHLSGQGGSEPRIA